MNGNGVVGAVLVIRDETRLVALERETEERRKYHSIADGGTIFLDEIGNIRELEHTIEYACILCRGTLITMEHLPVKLRKYAASKTPPCEALETDERLAIIQALEATAWNVAKAARKLGIGRRTIYRKIGLYQLKPPGY